MDFLLDSWKCPQLLRDYYTGGWHYHDKGTMAKDLVDDIIQYLNKSIFFFLREEKKELEIIHYLKLISKGGKVLEVPAIQINLMYRSVCAR